MIHIARPSDRDAWAAMRSRLWPSADPGDLALETDEFFAGNSLPALTIVFIAEDRFVPCGFLELSIRAFSDGCDSMPVPHVEGWYVEPHARGRGFGRALMSAAEMWAQSNGFDELASDTEVENDASLRAHLSCGFQEMERLIKFRKAIGTGPKALFD